MTYLKGLYGKIQGRAAVELNLGFLKVFFTIFRVLFVLWLSRTLVKAMGETQTFIGMFLTIILWF